MKMSTHEDEDLDHDQEEINVDDVDVATFDALFAQAADERCGHVAAADEGDFGAVQLIISHSFYFQKWRFRCARWYCLQEWRRLGQPTFPWIRYLAASHAR